ncbi:MAG: hypothetical protein N2746_10295 [Deltaproteobacteria bacterium]|nr:hypothetical protein [Deltaproteobacteria bacterium]
MDRWFADIKDMLLNRRVHLITGKGGVGKSVISISLAVTLRSRAKKVLFAQMSPIEVNADASDELFYKLRSSLPRIDYIYIEPKSALEEYATMVLRFKRLYKLIFEDKMVRSSLRAMPSLSFLLLIGKLWYYCTLKDKNNDFLYDYVVVDAPSTGMAISMLNLPRIINDAAPSGPLRDRAIDIENMLTDRDATAVHIATTCEETPVNEALEIYRTLSERLSIQFGVLFVNQFEDMPDEDAEYVKSKINLIPEHMRNCIRRKLIDISLRKQEYIRLVSNIEEKDRRIITCPVVENNFDVLNVIENISTHLRRYCE